MAPLRPIQIGNITIADPVILAPMTGVTDLPFRKIVRYYGSGLNVTEMIASQAAIRETRQSIQKAAWDPVEEPVSMQLVGCTPYEMGEAAKLNEERGAAIIDMLFGLRDRHGATLILVTHAPELANRCDRVIRLRDGLLDRAEAAA